MPIASRKHSRGVGLIVGLGLALAPAPPPPQPSAGPCEVPATWNLEEIAALTPPYGVEGRVYLLAWRILEDDRP